MAVGHALMRPEAVRGAPSLVVLGVRAEVHLEALADDLVAEGHVVTRFHEPDLHDSLTAVSLVAPGSPHLRRLSLLFTHDGEGR